MSPTKRILVFTLLLLAFTTVVQPFLAYSQEKGRNIQLPKPDIKVNQLVGPEFTVKGIVVDGSNGMPIPFAGVYFKGTTIGTTTDADGRYTLKTRRVGDSLTVKVVGFIERSVYLKKSENQTIDFRLEANVAQLGEVVIRAGENPAFRILRGVWRKRSENDRRSLEAFQYESYTKLEVDMDKVSERVRDKKVLKPIVTLFDSLKMMHEGESKYLLPIFFSESISDFYYNANPYRRKEVIRASRLDGVGLEDGEFVAQLMGSSFRDFNFYQDWIPIFDKLFVSPIAGEGRLYYEYYLVDSSYDAGGKKIYKIKVKPKRTKDLAFAGHIFVEDESFALRSIDIETPDEANINFIDKMTIKQELIQSVAGPWLPAKLSMFIDFGDITEIIFGAVAYVEVSNTDFVVNQAKSSYFFDKPVDMAMDAFDYDEQYWEKERHTPPTEREKRLSAVVDSVKRYGPIKGMAELAKLAFSGFYRAGKIDFGPYLFLYGSNPVEGSRFRMGVKTNSFFSKRWIWQAYLAYGTRDERFKQFFQVEHFLNRKKWVIAGYQYKNDLEALGIDQAFLADNKVMSVSTQAFAATAQLGLLDRFLSTRMHAGWVSGDIVKHLTASVMYQHKVSESIGNYVFSYKVDPKEPNSSLATGWTLSSLLTSLRWAPGEELLISGNDRGTVRRNYRAVYQLNYERGFRNFLGGDFKYEKVGLNISKNVKAGFLGWGEYTLTGSVVLGSLPYPLLEVQPGNETFFKYKQLFNMLNFFEIVTDQSVTFRGVHHFEGLLLNSIPGIKKLDLRLVAGGGVIIGKMSNKNKVYLPEGGNARVPTETPYAMRPNIPYAEVSYGLENIFKVARVELFHRLTYRNAPNAPKTMVKVSAYFAF